MDLKELREILQILEEKGVAEFELEQEGMKLRIRKGAAAPNPFESLAPVPAPTAATPASPAVAPPPVGALVDTALHVVKSPIVGTFYRSADPNSPPFVNTGDRVHVGQVLCIIEAMKLMNEIEAEVAGEIVKVHHESGQPVQYGDALFVIRTDH